MKKIFALILALCLILALAACGEAKPAESAAEAPAAEAPAKEIVKIRVAASPTPHAEILAIAKEALAAARCRRDVKYEYQAGASQRLKKAKLKISIPDFQPLDAGTGISSTLEALRQYVNPAADGAEGKLEGDTLISFYYGVRLMDWYQAYLILQLKKLLRMCLIRKYNKQGRTD